LPPPKTSGSIIRRKPIDEVVVEQRLGQLGAADDVPVSAVGLAVMGTPRCACPWCVAPVGERNPGACCAVCGWAAGARLGMLWRLAGPGGAPAGDGRERGLAHSGDHWPGPDPYLMLCRG
jgi:hypothetical protein